MSPRFPFAISLLLWSTLDAASLRKIDVVGSPSDYSLERDTLVYLRLKTGTVELAASGMSGNTWTIPTQPPAGTYHYDFDYSNGRLWFQALSGAASWQLVCQKLDGTSRGTVGSSTKYRESVRSRGERAVWIDYRNVNNRAASNSEVYTTTYPGLVEERITTDTLFQSSARTNGTHIAWMEYDPTRTRANIVVLDTRTGLRRVASPQAGHQDHPALSASHLVWTDYRNHPTEGDIYRMDLATTTVEPVCIAAGHQEKAITDGSMVYWQDFRSSGTSTIRGKNMATLEELEISKTRANATVVRTSLERVAWFESDTLVLLDNSAASSVRTSGGSMFARVGPGEISIRTDSRFIGQGARLQWIALDGARQEAPWTEIANGMVSVKIPESSRWRILAQADGSRWIPLATRSLAR